VLTEAKAEQVTTPSVAIANSDVRRLTSGSLLARNTVWNLVGFIAPMLAAVFAIPVLIRELGTERFGILTIAWMLGGYFSLLDLGLGRALTNLVANRLGEDDVASLPALFWTGNLLMAGLGVLGGVVCAALSPLLATKLLRLSPALSSESLAAFYVLSLSIPLIICSTGARAVLEAHQEFRIVNAIRIPFGVATFLAPLAVLPFSKSLVFAVATLVIARLASFLAYAGFALRRIPLLREHVNLDRGLVPLLFKFGGWMTVSNLISPLMVYLDRVLIGAMISAAAVAFYATPWEVATKFMLLPAAAVSVLFPAFATAAVSSTGAVGRLFDRAIAFVCLCLFPIAVTALLFSHEALGLWVGPEFAANSTAVLQWLSLGVFFNGLGYVPYALIQGMGRPDITAKLHMLELPFYVVLVLLATWRFGITGTAAAWSFRVALDLVLLLLCSRRLGPEVRPVITAAIVASSLAACLLVVSAPYMPFALRLAAWIVLVPPFMGWVWMRALSAEDRASCVRLINRNATGAP
jgi:O-antigen/teichoic acid export membrane protein